MSVPSRIIVAALAVMLAGALDGCAARRPLIIDQKGVDMAKYQQDLSECQSYADQVKGGKQVAGSAVGGAVVGGAVGAVVGDRHTAEKLAGVGAVVGAARGGRMTAREKRAVVRNCLTGRGYKVLN